MQFHNCQRILRKSSTIYIWQVYKNPLNIFHFVNAEKVFDKVDWNFIWESHSRDRCKAKLLPEVSTITVVVFSQEYDTAGQLDNFDYSMKHDPSRIMDLLTITYCGLDPANFLTQPHLILFLIPVSVPHGFGPCIFHDHQCILSMVKGKTLVPFSPKLARSSPMCMTTEITSAILWKLGMSITI